MDEDELVEMAVLWCDLPRGLYSEFKVVAAAREKTPRELMVHLIRQFARDIEKHPSKRRLYFAGRIQPPDDEGFRFEIEFRAFELKAIKFFVARCGITINSLIRQLARGCVAASKAPKPFGLSADEAALARACDPDVGSGEGG